MSQQAAFESEKARKQSETQVYLVEQQAQRREPLVIELTRKFMYPPICEKHKPKDGRGPMIIMSKIHPYITRTRAKQLRALLLDGGMVMSLMHSAGGLGEVLNTKTHLIEADGGIHVPLTAGRPHGGVAEVCLLSLVVHSSLLYIYIF